LYSSDFVGMSSDAACALLKPITKAAASNILDMKGATGNR